GVRACIRRRGSRDAASPARGAATDPRGHRPHRRPVARGGGMNALETAACELFGVRYPIVQTGMGWVAGARLAAATSAAGGLGIIASATMSLDELTRAVHTVKERTDAPFGINLRADADDIDRRLDLLVREGVKVASFAL